MLCKVSHCTGCVSVNTRPHQLPMYMYIIPMHHPCLLYHIFDTITPNENYAFLNLTITLVLILDLQSILRFESGYRASTITQLPHPVAMKVSECWRIEQVIV